MNIKTRTEVGGLRQVLPGESGKKYRLAILASHPIQYHVPLYRVIASNPHIDLTVLFCSDCGVRPYMDEGFGQELKWDIPLLDGYRSEFLPNVSLRPNISSFWGLLNPSVIRRLRDRRYDAIWVKGWSRCTEWLALLTAFVVGIPVLLRAETKPLSVQPVSAWKRRLKQIVLRRLFKRVSAFLTIGQQNASFYKAYGVSADRLFHVPYAVDNDFFIRKAHDLLPRRMELRERLGIPHDRLVILFSGKLGEIKRPMDLLRAYAELVEDSKAALIFVGDGPLRVELEAFTKEHNLLHVYFAGFQNHTEMPSFYAMADILVLPSESETWGLVVNEAMCFGLPVITSEAIGAAGDLVVDGVNGFLFSPGQVSALTQRLKLLTDGNQREQMGQESGRLIQPWNYAADVKGVLRCLNEVVGYSASLQGVANQSSLSSSQGLVS